MASLVFGLDSVPRTEEEWDVSTIIADQGRFLLSKLSKMCDVWYEITMMFDRGVRNLGKKGWL